MQTVVDGINYIQIKNLDEYKEGRIVVLYSNGLPFARSVECEGKNKTKIFRLMCLKTGLIDFSPGFSTLGDLCRQEQFYRRMIKVCDSYIEFITCLSPLIELYKNTKINRENTDERSEINRESA